MSTSKQRAASRANGQKSHGPTTPEGKAKSRFNALKHGINAQQQVMFTESAEDLAELAAEYHELHSPANADERFLVDTLINNEWRLRRLRCVEADLWRAATKLFLETHPDVTEAGSGDAFTNSGPAFDRLHRMMNSCERHYQRARQQLQAAQVARGHGLRTPQPEETKTTSESSGSFRTNAEDAATAASKLPPNRPKTAPETIVRPAVSADEQVQRHVEVMGAPLHADFGRC